MKFLHYVCTSLILLSLIFLIAGCTKEDVKTDGFILKIEESRILVAEDITI